ncbi:hypothetical protein HQ563_09980 [bacterium]|nr:hypothetical protein [bacterium]
MRERFRFTIEEAMPSESTVLAGWGMPSRAELSERIGTLLDEALKLLRQLAQPRGRLASGVSIEQELMGCCFVYEPLARPGSSDF